MITIHKILLHQEKFEIDTCKCNNHIRRKRTIQQAVELLSILLTQAIHLVYSIVPLVFILAYNRIP